MGLLTDLERKILSFAQQRLTDYRIGKKLSIDVRTIQRSHKNAIQKLQEAEEDITWAKSLGIQDFNVLPRKTIIKEETESPVLRAAF
jgi:hypothetical protein